MASEVKTWPQVVASDLFSENKLKVVVTDGARTETTVRTLARYSAVTPAAISPTPMLGEYATQLLHD